MKRLLLLDLDDTLIKTLKNWEMLRYPHLEPDFKLFSEYNVFKRPHLEQFLYHCFSNYYVGIWTNASGDYAEEITRSILGEKFGELVVFVTGLSSNLMGVKCTQNLKNMYNLHEFDIVLLDDCNHHILANIGNSVKISGYYPGTFDDSLVKSVDLINQAFARL